MTTTVSTRLTSLLRLAGHHEHYLAMFMAMKPNELAKSARPLCVYSTQVGVDFTPSTPATFSAAGVVSSSTRVFVMTIPLPWITISLHSTTSPPLSFCSTEKTSKRKTSKRCVSSFFLSTLTVTRWYVLHLFLSVSRHTREVPRCSIQRLLVSE